VENFSETALSAAGSAGPDGDCSLKRSAEGLQPDFRFQKKMQPWIFTEKI
jgi:hypothetical protein